MDKLKPCPFCGGEASRNEDKQHWGDIFCTKCGCSMNAPLNSEKAWNTRTNVSVPVEPTEEMIAAGQRAAEINLDIHVLKRIIRDIFKSMVAAYKEGK